MRARNIVIRRMGSLGAALVATFGFGADASADVIYTGNGAGASINALDQYSYSTSNPASASLNNSMTVGYNIYNEPTAADPYANPLIPGSTSVGVAASASASPGAGTLLQLQNSISSIGPQGPFIGAFSGNPQSQVEAGWYNVQATVQPPAGTAMPSSLQLEFRINYQNPDGPTNNSGSQVNGLGWPTSNPSLALNSYPITLTGAGTALQPGEQPVQMQSNGLLSGTFHVNLALSSTGTSPLFTLSIGSDLAALGQTLTDYKSLSLAGIYLPDGTPLPADYNVTFESGLPSPVVLAPVPEPAAIAVWAIVACFGANFARKRATRS